MGDPYGEYLAKLMGEEETIEDVTINRFGASDITGTIKSIGQAGCVIAKPRHLEGEQCTFVAFRDIRGVSTTGWDMEAIAN